MFSLGNTAQRFERLSFAGKLIALGLYAAFWAVLAFYTF